MAFQYVLVEFPTDRLFYVDGEKTGYTNEPVRVDAGRHVFTLGPLVNYEPESQRVVVKDTTSLSPMVIEFRRKDE